MNDTAELLEDAQRTEFSRLSARSLLYFAATAADLEPHRSELATAVMDFCRRANRRGADDYTPDSIMRVLIALAESRNGDATWLVFDRHQALVGFLGVAVSYGLSLRPELIVLAAYVNPAHRDPDLLGIAGDAMREWAREVGAKKITAGSQRRGAGRLFARLGFVRVAELFMLDAEWKGA